MTGVTRARWDKLVLMEMITDQIHSFPQVTIQTETSVSLSGVWERKGQGALGVPKTTARFDDLLRELTGSAYSCYSWLQFITVKGYCVSVPKTTLRLDDH